MKKTKPSKIKKTFYKCEFCGNTSENEDNIQECINSPENKPRFVKDDLVITDNYDDKNNNLFAIVSSNFKYVNINGCQHKMDYFYECIRVATNETVELNEKDIKVKIGTYDEYKKFEADNQLIMQDILEVTKFHKHAKVKSCHYERNSFEIRITLDINEL